MLESSGALACPRDELFTDPETLALSGFLAGYSGLIRDAYALDLRQFAGWVIAVGMRLFETRRVHIEAFARELYSVSGDTLPSSFRCEPRGY